MLKEILEAKKVSIKTLKDSKSLMGKWKVGGKYIRGFADFKNGRSKELGLFELVDYDASIKFEDEEDTFYDVTIHLKDLENGKIIKLNQDDRYGYYALLTNARKGNIQDTYDEAKFVVDELGKFIKKL